MSINEETQMKGSIVIPNFNGERFIKESIESALKSQPDQIIVVDDASTDGSIQVIERFLPKIDLIKLNKNGGQWKAWKASLARLKNDFVFLLDSDDLIDPLRLKKVLQVFRTYPNCQWCFNQVQNFNESGNLDVSPSSSKTGLITPNRAISLFGKCTVPLPSSSGLALKRCLFEKLLKTPIPDTSFLIGGDQLVRIAAITTEPGVFLNEPLSMLRHHSDNWYTGNPKRGIFNTLNQIVVSIMLSQVKAPSLFRARHFYSTYRKILQFDLLSTETEQLVAIAMNKLDEPTRIIFKSFLTKTYARRILRGGFFSC